MSILINKSTRVICQGFTGLQGTFHCQQAINYGTQIVGGVTPGKGGMFHLNLPVYNTVREAVSKTNANATIIYVPKEFAVDAILEAIDSNVDLIVCITEGIPILDMLKIKRVLIGKKTILVGPNCSGIITPEECKMGIMPSDIYKKGIIGIVSRSGTLGYEAVMQTSRLGLGQSTCVNIGGDVIHGVDFCDIIKLFLYDHDTMGIVLIGEIGGYDEQNVAMLISDLKIKKPIAALVVGVNAPIGKKMGHSGAILNQDYYSSAICKLNILNSVGVTLIPSPTLIGKTIKDLIYKNI